MRWVPGHKNIQGNERADQEAKQAAKGNPSTITDLPISLRGTLPICWATELQRHHEVLKREAQELFAKSAHVKFALEIDPSLPSTEFTKIWFGLGWRHISLLIQLWMGHIALNNHMYKIGKADTLTCQQCQEWDESEHHYLFQCPAYKGPWEHLMQTLWWLGKSTGTLLARPKILPAPFRYTNETKRFRNTHGDLALPEKDEENRRKRWEKRRTLYSKLPHHTETWTNPRHNPWSACKERDPNDRRITYRQLKCMTSHT